MQQVTSVLSMTTKGGCRNRVRVSNRYLYTMSTEQIVISSIIIPTVLFCIIYGLIYANRQGRKDREEYENK
jgi:hypothetical protein